MYVQLNSTIYLHALEVLFPADVVIDGLPQSWGSASSRLPVLITAGLNVWSSV